MSLHHMRRRALRATRRARIQSTKRFRLTQLSVADKIEKCITIGVCVLLTVTFLFALAYICFTSAVCVTLKRGTRQIEYDYPLTDPPDRQNR